jgi:hypothetical protein
MEHLLPPYLLLHVLPLDQCHHLEVPIPYLEYGVTPFLKKLVNLVLVPINTLSSRPKH